MAAEYLPHKEIGGDYYDCIWLNEDELVFCVADISGKGIAAALLMANFQANLRALIKQDVSLEIFVHLLNENVKHITKGEKFITLFLAKVNLKDRTLAYVNAGHNPPLLCNANSITQLDKGCTILGMFDHLPIIQVDELDFQNGALILTYTDGLTDLENEENEFFEMERLIEFAKTNIDEEPEEFNRKLMQKLKAFKGKRSFVDDITILTSRLH